MHPVIKPISVVLKEARQNKGVSLEEAYKATKIHHNILRSLEDGTTLGLGHMYVKSYIKIYAKYLNINQHELDKYFHPIPAAKEKKPRFDIPLKTKGVKIKSLSTLASLSFYAKRNRKTVAIAVASLALLVLVVSLVKQPRPKDAIMLGEVSIEDVKPEPKAAVVKEEVPKQPATVVKEEAPVPAIEGDGLRLTIFAKADTWMQIKSDGGIVYVGILKKGALDSWQAKDNFDLWLANGSTIDIKLNGKMLEPLTKRGVLKSVLITKEGLVINR